jgi:pimeloyl-ACP methyl ester carboxylesterase
MSTRRVLVLTVLSLALVPPVGALQDEDSQQIDNPRTWIWNFPTGPRNPLVEHHSLTSRAMNGRVVGYNVYLPRGYADSKARYPVIYSLHGREGNEWATARFAPYLQRAIEARVIPPVIAVYPNGGYASMYQDRPEQGVMAETLILRELIPEVDSRFRTIASGGGRALEGFSMGGFGALRFAFLHPELFSSVVTLGGGIPGTREARENARQIRGRVGLLLYAGDRDPLNDGHPRFVEQLKLLRIPCEYHVLPGVAHSPQQYHDRIADDMFRFHARHFAE